MGTKVGVCTEKIMCSYRFNILDVILHTDVTHRGGGQIIPTCLCHILESIFLVEFQCPKDAMNGIYAYL